MAVNPWGNRGLQPIVRPGDDGGPIEDVGRFFDPNRQEVTRNGQQWVRVGENLAETRGNWDPAAQQYLNSLSGEQLGVYDPEEGWLVPAETYSQLAEIMGPINAGGAFDPIAKALMFAAPAAVMGGMFPGIDAMTGASIPAGQTSLWSGIKSMLPGGNSPPGSYWNMSADAGGIGGTMTDAGVAGTMGDGIPALDEFVSGVGNVAKNAFTMSPGGALSFAGGTGGGMWGSALSSLMKPSTLVPLAGQAISGITGLAAANKAAGIQSDAVNQANANLAPWFNAGGQAIGALRDRTIGPNADLTRRFTMADLEADPVYQTSRQFGMDEGQKAIERKFAATGGGNSGAAAKAIARFASDYTGQRAGDAFNRFQTQDQNIYNRIAGVAGAGQNAANQTASNTIGMGNANAAASIAGSNAIGGAVNGFLNQWQNQQLLNRLPMYSMG